MRFIHSLIFSLIVIKNLFFLGMNKTRRAQPWQTQHMVKMDYILTIILSLATCLLCVWPLHATIALRITPIPFFNTNYTCPVPYSNMAD